MKKSIIVFAMAALFAACNSNPKNTNDLNTKVLSAMDTTGLHQFQVWKQQQELRDQQLIQTNGINDQAYNGLNNYAGSGQVRSYNNTESYADNQPAARPARRATTSRASTTHKTAHTRRVSSGSSTSGTSSGQSTAQTSRKKGWSSAAKGAVIGAGSGAVLGAVLSKNHGKGAIIGGILGAGGGYVLGRMKDKKTGRADLVLQ